MKWRKWNFLSNGYDARAQLKIEILDPPTLKLRGRQNARYDAFEQFLGVFWAWESRKLFITTIILRFHENRLDISIFQENWNFKNFPKKSIFSSKLLIIAHNQQNGTGAVPFSRLTLIYVRITQICPNKVRESSGESFWLVWGARDPHGKPKRVSWELKPPEGQKVVKGYIFTPKNLKNVNLASTQPCVTAGMPCDPSRVCDEF